jgi:pimeloyl-ACP methyl ester carboxylesterase
MWRRARRIALAAGFLAAVLAGAAVCERIASRRDLARYPPSGRLVDAGGFKLHLYCSGQGSPAVVLLSGFGMTSGPWTLVQREAGKITRVCSYDRAGYGWSESGPRPRTAARAADELSTLLLRGGVDPPYVLVGHSFGGELARIFAHRRPRDTAGLVLVATGHPDIAARDPALSATPSGPHPLMRIAPLLATLGLLRILPDFLTPAMFREYFSLLRQYLPPEVAEAEVAFLMRARHLQAMLDEVSAPGDGASKAARIFGVPLVVIGERWVFSSRPTEQEKARARLHEQLEIEMARFSPCGKRIAANSGHLVPLEKPGVITAAIAEVVEAAWRRRGCSESAFH